ncbi:cytochrome c biogenesis CcdA family protein [Ferrimonas senticii]|uniref:cytochrome c biogenesis CcdA family protein n=1 Tax=Ferrimonas senticii TaxID=394566 RepID=UPI000427BA3C|nr:cytochrome c biogenesis protein CcdA [Ferrimonas senticii]
MIDLAHLGLFGAFAAGLISFLSPCSLILMPGYLSFLGGKSQSHKQVINHSLYFISGLLTFFAALAIGTTYVARFVRDYQAEFQSVAGIFIILFGLTTLGWITFPNSRSSDCSCNKPTVISPKSAVASFTLGIAFAFGRSPCAGPILSAIVAYSATATTAASGMPMLVAYAFGFILPFLLMAFYFKHLDKILPSLTRIGQKLTPIFGGLLVFFGGIMATGQLPWISYQLSIAFPGIVHLG